jgi:hypothetical protein
MDSLNQTMLTLSTQQVVSIGTTINENYHLFLCDDGVVRTDTDVDGANLTSYKVRWIGFVRTNSYGVLLSFSVSGNDMIFQKYNDYTVVTNVNTTYVEVVMSSIIPLTRVSTATLGAWRSGSDAVGVHISHDGGASFFRYLTTYQNEIYDYCELDPSVTTHTRSSWTGRLVSLSVIALKLKR